MALNTPIERILDLARWAPSGDNTQPWRFEIVDGRHFKIHTHDTRDWCVYDLDGHASQLAIGALLENIAIAASGEGMTAEFAYHHESPEANLLIEVVLNETPDLSSHDLLPFITERTTQRRAFSCQKLTEDQKKHLEQAVGSNYRVIWLEGKKKRQMAGLLFRSAQIHLSIPEGYEVHKRIIEWDAQFSEDRIPDQAVGLDPLALKLMKWAIKSWQRVDFLNRFMAGTLLPRIELSLIPGLFCAAHFVIASKEPLQTENDYLDGGRALQRFWLEATRLKLQFQPEMAPVIFSRYASVAKIFTVDKNGIRIAKKINGEMNKLVSQVNGPCRVFMGRLGYGNLPKARSTRLATSKLIE
ncbi:nitroreductase family protein [Methylicorpusculum oleiharenae]|uniref:nitroreductase family protein n=1 Tax=Methylicorpusculum oleiharenae TaxID=1338687 RepID=UPI0013594ED8|nr:nitroreductase family protein [Methylicorpusculum oleiharenae]MCD2451337.1 nitroreductase family protein [Methylicorpusculum oleiharenae]